MNWNRDQRQSLSRRRIALALAATFLISTQGPIFVGIAAPSFFIRPNLGVSRAPLGVMSFGAPGFGEVSDAINLASGNVFLATNSLSKNNTPSSAASNVNSIGGAGWTTTARYRLNGFNSALVSAPARLDLEMGDQSSLGFTLESSVNWATAPKWIQRYQTATGATYRFYKLETRNGVAYQPDWIVLRINAGQTTFAHYYSADGTRYTFGFDGINADFMQTPDQQFRSAKRGQPEGRPMDGSSPVVNGQWPATDFSYSDPTNLSVDYVGKGFVTNVRDEYGRTTTYKWNANQTLQQINELLTDPANPSTYTRRTDFAYSASNLISSVTFTAKDGRGGTAARTVGFTYESDGRISKITRATKGGSRVTSYFYDATTPQLIARVSTADGSGNLLEPDVYYNYSGSGYDAAFVPGISTTVLDTTTTSNNCPSPATGSMLVPNDGGNDGQAVFLGCDLSVATYTVPGNLESARYRISLRAKAQELEGPPIAEVKLNNVVIATPSWTGNQYRDGDIAEANVSPGDTLTVRFTNDKCGTATLPCNSENDRNMFVDTITLAKIGAVIPVGIGIGANVSVGLPANLVKGYYNIRVKARGDQYKGAPLLEVKQGATVLGQATVASTTIKTYTLGSANLIPSGTLLLNFPNDLVDTGGDRNLFVDSIELEQVYSTNKGSRLLTVTQGDKFQEYEIDQFDRLRRKTVTVSDPVAGTTKNLESRYEYYPNGNLALEVEPSGRATHYVYDPQGLLVRKSVYRTNPFGPNYTAITDAKLSITNSGSWVFGRGEVIEATATVFNDYARQGVDWLFYDPVGTRIYPTITEETSALNPDVANGYSYEVKMRFNAPTFNFNWDDPDALATRSNYRIALVTRKDRAAKAVTYALSTKIKRLDVTAFPTTLVVSPGCVQIYGSAGCGSAGQPDTLEFNGQAIPHDQFSGVNRSVTWSANGLGASFSGGRLFVPYLAQLAGDSGTVELKVCSVEETGFCRSITVTVLYAGLRNTGDLVPAQFRWDNPGQDAVVGAQGTFWGAAQSWQQTDGRTYKQLSVLALNFPRGVTPDIGWSVSDFYSYMRSDFVKNIGNGPLLDGFSQGQDGALSQSGCLKTARSYWDGWWLPGVRNETRYLRINASLRGTTQVISNWVRVNFGENDMKGANCIDYRDGSVTATGTYNPSAGGWVRAQSVNGGNPTQTPSFPSSYIDYGNWISFSGVGGTATGTNTVTAPDFSKTLIAGFESLERYGFDSANRQVSSYRQGTTEIAGLERATAYASTVFSDPSGQTFEVMNAVTSSVRVGGSVSSSSYALEPSGLALNMTAARTKRATTTNFNDRGLPISATLSTLGVSNYSSTAWSYWSTDASGNPTTTLESATLPAAPGGSTTSAVQYPYSVKSVTETAAQTGSVDSSVATKVQRFVYDALDNPVKTTLDGVVGDIDRTVTAEVAATATVPKIPSATTKITTTKWSRVTEQSFNGYGQLVWQRTTLQDSGVIKNVGAERAMTYAPTGELLTEWSGAQQNLTKYNYNASNRLTSVQRGVGASGTLSIVRREIQFGYDIFGRTSSVREKNQAAATTLYDSLDRAVKITKPDGSGGQTQYDVSGQPSEVKEYRAGGALKIATTQISDSLGRARSRTVTPNDGSPSYTLTFEYDRLGNMTATTHSDASLSASATDRETKMVYDEEGNRVFQRSMKLRGNAGAFVGTADQRSAASATTFDDLNRETETRVQLYGANGNTVTSSEDTATSKLKYDSFDNVIERIDPNGYSTVIGYDAAGNTFATQRQVWKNTEPANILGKGTNPLAIVGSAFDAAGRGVKTVDGAGNRRQVRYDTLGNKTAEVDERGYVTKGYSYTDDGLPLGLWEPRFGAGTAALLSNYNFVDPSVKTGTTTPSGHSLTQFNVFDAATTRPYPTKIRRALGSDTGTLTPSGTGGAESSYTYDWAGRILTTTMPADAQGATQTVMQTYDENSNTTKVIDADGFTTTYKYDYRNKVLEQKQLARSGNTTDSGAGVSGGLTSTYKYDAYSNLIQKNERGIVTDYAYNSIGKVVAESRPRRSGQPLSIAGLKRFAYRLDGEKVGETNYSYTGTFDNQPTVRVQVIAIGASFVTAGSRSIYELDSGGRVLREATFGYFDRPSGLDTTDSAVYSTLVRREKLVTYTYNGLNLRVGREFVGDPTIYATQRDATGLFLRVGAAPTTNPFINGDTAYQTYMRYDNRGKLLEQFEQNAAINGASTFNRFTYEYSASSRETLAFRDVRTRASAFALTSGGGWVDTTLGGTVLLAATVGNTVSTYNERDLLMQSTVSDQGPYLIKDLSASVSRITDYLYFSDGSKKQVTVNDGKTGGGNSTVKYAYDARGRETKIEDSNGGADTRRDASDVPLPTNQRKNITGTAVTSTTYSGAGQITTTVTDGAGLCYSQENRVATVAGITAKSDTWDWEPEVVSANDVVVTAPGFACGTGTPSRAVSTTYNANGDPTQVSVTSNPVNKIARPATPFIKHVSSTQTSTIAYEAQFGNRSTENTTIATTTYDGGTVTTTRRKTASFTFNGNNRLTSETRSTTTTDATNVTTNTPETTDGAMKYVLSSNGERLKVLGGQYDGFIKRFDASDKATAFFKWQGDAAAPQASYNDFAFDPYGAQVLSSNGGIKQFTTTPIKYEIVRDVSGIYSSEGGVQVIRKRIGKTGNYATIPAEQNYTSAENTLTRDNSYTSADGLVDSVTWNGIVPFSATPNTGGQFALEAPVKPLSAQVGITPSSVLPPSATVTPSTGGSSVTAPNSGSAAPTTGSSGVIPPVTAPSNTTTSSNPTVQAQSVPSTSSSTVSSPSVGVTVASPATPASSKPTATSAPQPSSNAPSTPAASSSNSSVQSLQAPSSVLPPSISGTNASSVTAPQNSTSSVVPNTGVNSSGVTAPSSVTVPSTGTTPSSVTAPVTGGVVPSVTGGSSGSIVKPQEIDDGTLKPLGQYDTLTGKCFESPSAECRTSESLRDENRDLEARVNAQTASLSERLQLAENRAQLQLRAEFGNDAAGDDVFRTLKGSTLVAGGVDNKGNSQYALSPERATVFWNELALDIKVGVLDRAGIKELMWFADKHVVQWDASGKPYFFRWEPRFGQDKPLVLDLPGGSPLFVNGDAKELNSKLSWVSAGFLQSAFGGWNPSEYRKTVLSGSNKASKGFVGSGCRHPSMNKPTGNMPRTDSYTNGLADWISLDPVNADINSNIRYTIKHRPFVGETIDMADTLTWFYNAMKYNAPWDFKNWGPGEGKYPEYENFGNFHYGAVGSAALISPLTLHQAAGASQIRKGTSGVGNSSSEILIGANATIGTPISGSGAFGDDPKDFYWISSGIDYYNAGCWK